MRAEIFSGVSAANLSRVKRVISALPVFYPSRDTWLLVDRWIARAVRLGERFGVMDLLIGAICAERGGQIWSLDDDFERLARLKLVRTYAPRRLP